MFKATKLVLQGLLIIREFRLGSHSELAKHAHSVVLKKDRLTSRNPSTHQNRKILLQNVLARLRLQLGHGASLVKLGSRLLIVQEAI